MNEKITAKCKTYTGEGKTAKVTGEIVASVDMDFGDDLDELVEKYGEAVVFRNAIAAFRISLQSAMRAHVKSGGTADDMQAKVADKWEPPTGVPRKSREDKLVKLLKDGKFTEEQLRELLARAESEDEDEEEGEGEGEEENAA